MGALILGCQLAVAVGVTIFVVRRARHELAVSVAAKRSADAAEQGAAVTVSTRTTVAASPESEPMLRTQAASTFTAPPGAAAPHRPKRPLYQQHKKVESI